MIITRRKFIRRSTATAAAMGLPVAARSDVDLGPSAVGPTGPVRVAQLDNEKQAGVMRTFFENEHPGLKLTVVDVDGEAHHSSANRSGDSRCMDTRSH
jgi:hypothetical protein